MAAPPVEWVVAQPPPEVIVAQGARARLGHTSDDSASGTSEVTCPGPVGKKASQTDSYTAIVPGDNCSPAPMRMHASPENSSGSNKPSLMSPANKELSRLRKEELINPADLDGLANDDYLIGSGAFGEVRKVQWRKTPAAAKIAHANMPEKEKQLFLRELEVMVRVRHPNIVQFLGYIDTPFVIVMELCHFGDLRSYWRRRNVGNSHKVAICIDVLRALAYLHNRAPSPIVHRDVKPTNVLLTASGIAKLTDFGLARHEVAPDVLSSKYKGSPARAGLTGTVADLSAHCAMQRPLCRSESSVLLQLVHGLTPRFGVPHPMW